MGSQEREEQNFDKPERSRHEYKPKLVPHGEPIFLYVDPSLSLDPADGFMLQGNWQGER